MELLKLLIADDEENIRNGIKCILDWESLGYKFCGEASNGKDTVNQIIDLQPDLVILDIKMPGLTGIEVITQIKDYCEKRNISFPSFLILSGYSEFEYAQKTINLGAKAFLLKPVDEDELKDKVLIIAKEINEKKKISSTYKTAEALEIKDTLIRLIHKENIDLDRYSSTSFFENYEESTYQTGILFIDYLNEGKLEELTKSMDNNFSFFNYVFIKSENKIIIFFKTSNEQAVRNCIERVAKLNNGKTCFTLGTPQQGVKGIISSYDEALSYEKYIFFFSEEPYIHKSLVESCVSNIDKDEIEKIIRDIIFSIETYDKNKLAQTEDAVNSMLFGVNNSEEIIKKQFLYILIELRNKLSAKYPEKELSNIETFDIVQKILELKSYKDTYIYFKTVLINYLENFNYNTTDSVIVKVIAYIKSNYQQDLKLETLGDMFNCNSAYLGKKFKKYTGVQFNTYLDNLRIEEAKEKIINSNLKIYQISKLVGYTNTDYFFMKFKKNTGLTPKEYKKYVEENKQN